MSSFNTEKIELIKVEDIDDKRGSSIKKLIFVCVLCFIFMGVEICGGLYAHSLAILTDAAHLFSDISGFMISVISIWIG